MSLEGVVINGRVEFTAPANLPDGTRVWVDLVDETDVFPPPEPYDREKELEILRESIEDAKAGRTRPAREVLKEIAVKYGLPLEPGE